MSMNLNPVLSHQVSVWKNKGVLVNFSFFFNHYKKRNKSEKSSRVSQILFLRNAIVLLSGEPPKCFKLINQMNVLERFL